MTIAKAMGAQVIDGAADMGTFKIIASTAISHHHGSGLTRFPYVSEIVSGSLELVPRVKTAVDR